MSSASPFDQRAEYSISGSWLRTQRREECGLYFTSLPSLALDLKFHTTEPNTSRDLVVSKILFQQVMSPISYSACALTPYDPAVCPHHSKRIKPRHEHSCVLSPRSPSREPPNMRNRKLCLAADKLFQCPWDLQDVWNEERRTSQELSRGPQKNVLCRRRVFPIRQTVLQPWLPKRGNPGLLFSGPECSCILPFLCFLSRYLLMVHARGLGKLSV
ncbi:uncharacterized protein [Symphalangus syndactylus]|uniref:uncharacterized protein n=1 Tax=Symphalangus syndactylus TaxID=9590 RepID=UPI003006DE9D